jgi:Secretion system C-terminal sorting domain
MKNLNLKNLLFVLFLFFSFGAKAQQKKILFIGNSFTYANGNAAEPEIPISINGIAQNINPVDNLSYTIGDQVIQGGQTLQGHYNAGAALQKIRQGGWDYVVLQEQSLRPYDNPELYYQYVRLFDAEIKLVGAKTVIYMTWAYKNDWYKFPTYVSNFERIANEINAIVVPCGKAWEKAKAERPNFNLYAPDDVHPSSQGSYLNACVFFATLTGRNPEETYYVPYIYPLPLFESQYARTNAWQTVQAYVQPAQSNNLLVNPGFENGNYAWTLWGNPSISTSNQRSGNKCDSLQKAWDGDCQRITTGFSVGDNLSYSAWFKFSGIGTGGGNILYQCFSGETQISIGSTYIPSYINNRYTKYTVNFSVPANTTDLRLSFGNNSNQFMFIDDAVLINNSANRRVNSSITLIPNNSNAITSDVAKISISPNPFTDHFVVTLFSPKEENFTISILDASGKIVMTKKVFAKQQVLNFDAMPTKGMYLLKVTNSKNEVITEKIIQQ